MRFGREEEEGVDGKGGAVQVVLGKGGVQRPYLGCEELQAPRRVTRGGRGLEVGEGARKGA